MTTTTEIKTIICLHGLGASSASFDDLKRSDYLADYQILTPDCAGHAKLLKETYQGDPLDFAAGQISTAIKNVGKTVALVGHSMGGALAILILQKIPDLVSAVISIEGNLIGEDCGLISRKIAAAKTTDDILKLRHDLVEFGRKSPNSGLQRWAEDIAEIAPQTLKDYASSLVMHSDRGDLIKTFTAFPKSKAYIHGDAYTDHVLLHKLGTIPSYHVAGADHFVMQDAPACCANLIDRCCRGLA
jgi:pimeloyl-ACP methyl ester carboxylesterase